MEILSEVNAEDPRFLLLTVDGSLWKEVYKSLFIRRLDFLRRSKDLLELESRWGEVEQKAAKEAALRLLALRSYSSHEMEQKLSDKGLSASAIENALEECRRLGYLSDQDEARRFVEREQRRGYGPYLIALKVKRRGLPLSQELAAEMQRQQCDQLKQLLLTRYRKRALKDPKERQKMMQVLRRRGFDLESIRSVIYKVHVGQKS